MQIEQQGERKGDAVVGGAALARLIAEVRRGDSRAGLSGYNRTYNRHNR